MAIPGQAAAVGRRPIAHLRWWIGALLFASTVINYLDRQTLSLLAPFLKQDYHWTNTDYANLLIGFRVAYSIGQTVFGRLMDRLGTRRGPSITVLGYSIVSMCTALANGFYSFATLRFCSARGIRQLAGGDQGSFGMVSQTRARLGDCPLRQRLLYWWRDLSLSGAVDLLPLGSGVLLRRSGFAGVGAAGRLAHGLLFAGGSSAHLRGRARHDLARRREDVAAPTGFGCAGANWLTPRKHGARSSPKLYRSGLVFRNRLVPDLPCGQGHSPERQPVRIWIPFVAADLGNFWWRRVRLPDQAAGPWATHARR